MSALSSSSVHPVIRSVKSIKANNARGGCTLCGKLLTAKEKDGSGGWTFFSPNSSWYRVGDNEFDFRMVDGFEMESNPVEVVAVDVLVRYKD